jgi:hypothetical protein
MVAATSTIAVPKYFPSELDLPLPPGHKTWHTERLCRRLKAQALKSESLTLNHLVAIAVRLASQEVG